MLEVCEKLRTVTIWVLSFVIDGVFIVIWVRLTALFAWFVNGVEFASEIDENMRQLLVLDFIHLVDKTRWTS